MKPMKTIAAAALAAASINIAAVQAADMDGEAFAKARLEAFGKGDIEAIMAQYSDDATWFTPGGVLQGKAQIRPAVLAILNEFSMPGSRFELISMTANASAAALVFKAETAKTVYVLGVETYVLSEGKVVQHTAVLNAKPK